MSSKIDSRAPNSLVLAEGVAITGAFFPPIGIPQVVMGGFLFSFNTINKPVIDKGLVKEYLGISISQLKTWKENELKNKQIEFSGRITLLQTQPIEERNINLKRTKEVLDKVSTTIILNKEWSEQIKPIPQPHPSLTESSAFLENLVEKISSIEITLKKAMDPFLEKYKTSIAQFKTEFDEIKEAFENFRSDLVKKEVKSVEDLNSLVTSLQNLMTWKRERSEAIRNLKNGAMVVFLPGLGGAIVGLKTFKECEKMLKKAKNEHDENLFRINGKFLRLSASAINILLGPVIGLPQTAIGHFLVKKTQKLKLGVNEELLQNHKMSVGFEEELKQFKKDKLIEILNEAKAKFAQANKALADYHSNSTATLKNQANGGAFLSSLANKTWLYLNYNQTFEKLKLTQQFSDQYAKHCESLDEELLKLSVDVIHREIQKNASQEKKSLTTHLDKIGFQEQRKDLQHLLNSLSAIEKERDFKQFNKTTSSLERGMTLIESIKKNESFGVFYQIQLELSTLVKMEDPTITSKLKDFKEKLYNRPVMHAWNEINEKIDNLSPRCFSSPLEQLCKDLKTVVVTESRTEEEEKTYDELHKLQRKAQQFNESDLGQFVETIRNLPIKHQYLKDLVSCLPIVKSLDEMNARVDRLKNQPRKSLLKVANEEKNEEEQAVINKSLAATISNLKKSLKTDQQLVAIVQQVEELLRRMDTIDQSNFDSHAALKKLIKITENFENGKLLIEKLKSQFSPHHQNREILDLLKSTMDKSQLKDLENLIKKNEELLPFVEIEQKLEKLILHLSKMDQKFSIENF